MASSDDLTKSTASLPKIEEDAVGEEDAVDNAEKEKPTQEPSTKEEAPKLKQWFGIIETQCLCCKNRVVQISEKAWSKRALCQQLGKIILKLLRQAGAPKTKKFQSNPGFHFGTLLNMLHEIEKKRGLHTTVRMAPGVHHEDNIAVLPDKSIFLFTDQLKTLK